MSFIDNHEKVLRKIFKICMFPQSLLRLPADNVQAAFSVKYSLVTQQNSLTS